MDQQQRVVKFEVEAVVQYGGHRDDLQFAIRALARHLRAHGNGHGLQPYTFETRDVRVTGKGEL